jgi:hypothetical protein
MSKADWFLYLKPIPRTRLTHRPDDGGSKDLWNVGKLLLDYTALQPGRQPSRLLSFYRNESIRTWAYFLSFQIHSKIIFESSPIYSLGSFSFMYSDRVCIYIFNLNHTCYMSRPLYSNWFYYELLTVCGKNYPSLMSANFISSIFWYGVYLA